MNKGIIVYVYATILILRHKSETLLFVTTWMELEDIILSE